MERIVCLLRGRRGGVRAAGAIGVSGSSAKKIEKGKVGVRNRK